MKVSLVTQTDPNPSSQEGPAPAQLRTDPELFDWLARCLVMAGLRPDLVEKRWPAFREAYQGFVPHKVAAFTDADIEMLTSSPGLLRNRSKHSAIVDNARVVCALHAERGSFAAWLRSLPDDPVARVTSITCLFRRVGPWTATAFLERACPPGQPQKAA